MLPGTTDRVQEVGFENMRGIGAYNGDYQDPNHTEAFILWLGTQNTWARNIVTEVYPTAVSHVRLR